MKFHGKVLLDSKVTKMAAGVATLKTGGSLFPPLFLIANKNCAISFSPPSKKNPPKTFH